MSDLIERYVYSVTRRLAESERAEVAEELRANIYDMLSENPDKEEIVKALKSLGAPGALAEKYTNRQRYLISPLIYGDYVRALKWIVPLVGVIALVAGAIASGINGMGESPEAAELAARIISGGISAGVYGAFQAVFWITAGFVIAERTGAFSAKQSGEFEPDELPPLPKGGRYAIPLSDSIVELAMVIVFYAVGVLFFLGKIPLALSVFDGKFKNLEVFGAGLLSAIIPVMSVAAVFAVLEATFKIIYRRWNLPVCAAYIANALASAAAWIYALGLPEFFSPEFKRASNGAGLENLPEIMGRSGVDVILLFVSAAVVLGTALGCGWAIYRTVKNSLEPQAVKSKGQTRP